MECFFCNEQFDEKFKSAIYSNPFIYIEHYDASLIINKIRHLCQKEINGLDVSINDVCLYGYTINGPAFFDANDNKLMELSDDFFSTMMKIFKSGLCENEGVKELSGKKIFVFQLYGTLSHNYSNEQIYQDKVQYIISKIADAYYNNCYRGVKCIIFISTNPVNVLPVSILPYFKVLDFPTPNEDEISRMIDNSLKPSKGGQVKNDEYKSSLCRTLLGLQKSDITNILKTVSSKNYGSLKGSCITTALEEKQQIVKKSGIIEVVSTNVKLEDVGGLKILSNDIKRKAKLYNKLSELNKLNFSLPKGILIVGMPGCGKTMMAKAIANEFNVSLLRLDVNKLMGKYVGQSETNLAFALRTAEAANPCVLWIDEVEKAFAGSNTSGQNDVLVTRLMGYFLTWLQERTAAVYVVATANDAMKPEFMRKGRFDEVYFVDFPTKSERKQILEKCLEKFKDEKYKKYIDLSNLNDEACKKISECMEGFSGSEIVAVVQTVMEQMLLKYFDMDDMDDKDKNVKTIEVSQLDFKTEINSCKNSIMSRQHDEQHPTPIDNIKNMHKRYNFKNASMNDIYINDRLISSCDELFSCLKQIKESPSTSTKAINDVLKSFYNEDLKKWIKYNGGLENCDDLLVKLSSLFEEWKEKGENWNEDKTLNRLLSCFGIENKNQLP